MGLENNDTLPSSEDKKEVPVESDKQGKKNSSDKEKKTVEDLSEATLVLLLCQSYYYYYYSPKGRSGIGCGTASANPMTLCTNRHWITSSTRYAPPFPP